MWRLKVNALGEGLLKGLGGLRRDFGIEIAAAGGEGDVKLARVLAVGEAADDGGRHNGQTGGR